MQHYFLYLIEVSACYAALYLFYIMVLRRLTHYTGNRFFLLIASVAAFLIPLFPSGFLKPPADNAPASLIQYIPDITATATRKLVVLNDNASNGPDVVMWLLIGGAIFFCLRFCIQLFSLKKLTASAKIIRELPGAEVYHLEGEWMPFTFGNRVYLNEHRHTKEDIEKIIDHEAVHVRQHHTLDTLLMELVCILNWYNPFVWMIKCAVKHNLEFLADDAVLRNGADKKNYQYLLLKATGCTGLTIVTPLSFSSLKNRIYMMNRSRHSNKHLLKFLFIVPVILFILLAFRNDDDNSQQGLFRVSKVTYAVDDPLAETLVELTKKESVLQAGQPFTAKGLKNERDRLKYLLEKNGFGHITSHTITFLVDSSLTNNSFAVQVNIELREKTLLMLEGNTPLKAPGNSSPEFKTPYNHDITNAARPGVSRNQRSSKM